MISGSMCTCPTILCQAVEKTGWSSDVRKPPYENSRYHFKHDSSQLYHSLRSLKLNYENQVNGLYILTRNLS